MKILSKTFLKSNSAYSPLNLGLFAAWAFLVILFTTKFSPTVTLFNSSMLRLMSPDWVISLAASDARTLDTNTTTTEGSNSGYNTFIGVSAISNGGVENSNRRRKLSAVISILPKNRIWTANTKNQVSRKFWTRFSRWIRKIRSCLSSNSKCINIWTKSENTSRNRTGITSGQETLFPNCFETVTIQLGNRQATLFPSEVSGVDGPFPHYLFSLLYYPALSWLT